MGSLRDDLSSCQQRPFPDEAADIECRRTTNGRAKLLCLLGALALALGGACGTASKKHDARDADPTLSPDSRSGDVSGQGGSTGTAGSLAYDALVDSRNDGTTMGGSLDASGGTQGTGGAGGTGGASGGNDDALGGSGGSVDALGPDSDSGQGGGGGTTGTNSSTGKNDGSAAGGSGGDGGIPGPDAASIPSEPDAAQVDSQSSGGGGGGSFRLVLAPSLHGGVRMSSVSYRLVAALTSGMAWATVSTSPQFRLQQGFATKSK
jgi:hypothetical protein